MYKFRHDLIWYDPEAPFSEDKYVPFFQLKGKSLNF